MTFSQRRGVLRIDSEIGADGVLYRNRNLLSATEVKIPFESISDDVARSFHVSRWHLLICAFFAIAFAMRLSRYLTTDTVTFGSLVWSAVLVIVPIAGTWMQSPRYVGYLTDRGSILFFDRKGPQDPSVYLQEIQQAKDAYLRMRYADRSATNRAGADESTAPAVH